MRCITIQGDPGALKAYPWQTPPRTTDSPLCQNSLQDDSVSARCTSWHRVLAGGFADATVPTAALAESVFLQRSRGAQAGGSTVCLVHISPGGQSIFLHWLRALEECFDFSGILGNCRYELGCSGQSLKMGRAANS